MAAEMVMIGCKHPHGVVLNLDHYVVTDERSLTVRRINGKATVTLKGWSHGQNKVDPTEGQGGYALTPVPADFWEAWIKEHAEFPMIVDKVIVGPHKDAAGQARSMAGVPKMFDRHSGKSNGVEALKKND